MEENEIHPTSQEPQESLESQSFEQALTKLEDIVNQLGNGRAPLAEALTLFEQGASLLKFCNTQLDEAEQKVDLVLSPGENGEATLGEMPGGES